MFSTVEEADAREVLSELAGRGYVLPELLARLEYVGSCGEHKDLAFVPGAASAEVLLVDDDPGWVRPDQRRQWGRASDGRAAPWLQSDQGGSL